jgi:hypothetical protein
MAIAACQNCPLFQLDVNTAFLHGDLTKEVYMKPPPSLHVTHPDLVCKLQTPLYGLKQANRQWNTKLLTETLISLGYIQSKVIIHYSPSIPIMVSPLLWYMLMT